MLKTVPPPLSYWQKQSKVSRAEVSSAGISQFVVAKVDQMLA